MGWTPENFDTTTLLRDSAKPMGVAEYQLVAALPADLQTSLPSIEQIEQELASLPENDEKAKD